jgi:sarcosine oxidase, subunit gamma
MDLHPRAVPPGRCAGTLLAKATVLLHLVDNAPERGSSFDVYVARSFALISGRGWRTPAASTASPSSR